MAPVLSAGLGLEDTATLEPSRAADSILESGLTKTQKASFFKTKFEKKKKAPPHFHSAVERRAFGPPGLQAEAQAETVQSTFDRTSGRKV